MFDADFGSGRNARNGLIVAIKSLRIRFLLQYGFYRDAGTDLIAVVVNFVDSTEGGELQISKPMKPPGVLNTVPDRAPKIADRIARHRNAQNRRGHGTVSSGL